MNGDSARHSERSVSEAGAKMSDRPWSIDEMRKSSGNWSLASDSGTHEIQEQVDRLSHETKMTNVRLSNTFNDFTTLANTQFMENRVYDEEVAQPPPNEATGKTDDKEKTKEQREAELIPRIMEAITLGLNVFDSAYETLDMNIANSDSEDEELVNKADIILEPKDPYLHRRLPCLIGSEDFHQMDDLGLSNLLVDEKEESDSESDNEGKKEVKEPTVKSTPSAGPPARVDDSDESSDEELFSEPKRSTTNKNGPLSSSSSSSSSDDELTGGDRAEVVPKKAAGVDFSSELAARIGATASGSNSAPSADGSKTASTTKKPGSGPTAAVVKNKESSHRPKPDDLFGADNEDDDDDLFNQPTGLFSSRAKGLFDKDDSAEGGGGLFDASPDQPSSKSAGVVSSAAQDAVKRKSSIDATKQPATSKNSTKTTAAPPVKGLFDDDDDDDGDIFSSQPVQKKPQDRRTSLLEDSDSSRPSSGKSSDRSEVKTANKPKLPAGAVSIFGGGDDQFKAAVVERRASNDDSSSALGSASGASKLTAATGGAKSLKPGETAVKKTAAAAASSSSPSKDSLFGDDDDLFAPVVKPVSKQPAVAANTSSQGGVKGGKLKLSLFDDVEDSEDLFSTVVTPATKKTAAAAAPATPKVDTKPSQTTNQVQPTTSKTGPGSKITLPVDDDDDDDDLFSVMTKAKDVTQKKNTEKHAPVQVPEAAKVPETQVPDSTSSSKVSAAKETTKAAAKKPLSMFDDDDEDDDLFAPTSKSKPSQNKPSQPAASVVADKKTKGGPSLFDDDLFFTDREDGPVVDLFGEVGQVTKPTSSSKIQPVTDTTKRRDSKSDQAKAEATDKQTNKESNVSDTNIVSGGLGVKDAVDRKGSLPKGDLLDAQVYPPSSPSPKRGIPPTQFGAEGEEDDEDLFASTETKPAKKLPAGAVSMFGTGNKQQDALRDAFKKRGIQAEQDPVIDDDVGENPLAPAAASTATNDHSARLGAAPIVPSKSGAKAKTVNGSSFDATDLFSSHSSQQTPRSPTKVSTEAIVNFDIPPQASTLSNISKDRARGPGKRRLPTRKTSVDQPDGDTSVLDEKQYSVVTDVSRDRSSSDTNAASGRPKSFSISSTSTSVPKEAPVAIDKKVPSSTRVFPLDNDDDLFGVPSKSTIPSTIKKQDNNLGSSKSNTSTKLTSEDDEDLFSPQKTITDTKISNKKDDSKFSVASKTLASTTERSANDKFINDDDDDDIFAIATKKPVTAVKDEARPTKTDSFASSVDVSKSSNTVPRASDVTIPAANISDVDDIFSSPVHKVNNTAALSKVNEIQRSTVPDDDDIFADASILKKNSNDVIKPTEKPPILADDDDDIFAVKPSSTSAIAQKVKEPTTSTTTRTSRKKAATKDENLFSDETDIFADLAPPKAKDKRSTKTDKPVPVGAGDEDEDIFATSTTKPKSAKTKAPSTTKASTKRNDEPADIFDDPLNALMK